MTREYDTKEKALAMGAYYAGVSGENVFDGIIPEKMKISGLDEKYVDVYKIKNCDDDDIGVGIGNFRKGYDLWIINLGSREGVRA
ncbi:MAG: hypothetical protein U9P44_01095 [archaeon]|nr:hypothetical protein [archaeon]